MSCIVKVQTYSRSLLNEFIFMMNRPIKWFQSILRSVKSYHSLNSSEWMKQLLENRLIVSIEMRFSSWMDSFHEKFFIGISSKLYWEWNMMKHYMDSSSVYVEVVQLLMLSEINKSRFTWERKYLFISLRTISRILRISWKFCYIHSTLFSWQFLFMNFFSKFPNAVVPWG